MGFIENEQKTAFPSFPTTKGGQICQKSEKNSEIWVVDNYKVTQNLADNRYLRSIALKPWKFHLLGSDFVNNNAFIDSLAQLWLREVPPKSGVFANFHQKSGTY